MLGERLTKLRKQRNLTQQQVAEKLHFSRATYAQYEINRRVPEYLTLEKLADFFEVSIDYLVGRTNTSFEFIDDNLPDIKKEMIDKVKEMTNDEAKFISEMYDRMKKK